MGSRMPGRTSNARDGTFRRPGTSLKTPIGFPPAQRPAGRNHAPGVRPRPTEGSMLTTDDLTTDVPDHDLRTIDNSADIAEPGDETAAPAPVLTFGDLGVRADLVEALAR